MKKKFILLLFSLVIFCPVFPQTVDQVIEELITEITLKFNAQNSDLVFKPNLAVIPVENNSPSAQKYEVGPAFTAIIESLVSRSVIFGMVDEKLRDKAIDEIKFSLSGLAKSESMEIGEIESVDYFLAGQVTELGEDFRLFLHLIDVETGVVTHTVDGIIPKKEVFETTAAFTAAYVSPYGIGLEINGNPWTYIYGETADIEGQPFMPDYGMVRLALNYRIRKWLVVWGGMDINPSSIRFENTYDPDTPGIPFSPTTAENFENAADIPDFNQCYYKLNRSPYYAFLIGGGWVWNPVKSFNLTLGATISMAQTWLIQTYNLPFENESEVDSGSKNITSGDMMLFSFIPSVKAQYFITPRLAVNLEYGFKIQFAGQNSPSNYFYQDGEYGDSGTITTLYGLDPRYDINGNEFVTNLTGHVVSVGIGFYF